VTKRPITLGTTEDPALEERRARAPARPFLFVVLHCDRPALGGARYCLSDLDVVDIGRGAERAASRVRHEGARRLDLRLPGKTISKAQGRLVRSGNAWTFEDAGSRNGSCINGKRVTRAALKDGDFIELGGIILRYRASLPASPDAAADLDLSAPETAGFHTLLPPLADELDALARIARTPITVLLLGESGTGKEVLAQGIHALSRRAGPLVAVNCGALTASLLESQLFGHVKGAFTGAIRDELGYIRRADGGTLFLDEVGDLPPPAQATLLRVLEEREVAPVGGTVPVKVNLRVAAATHKPLEKMAIRGEFRVDLLARLSGHQHTVTPLRDRIEDMGILVRDLRSRSEVPGASDLGFSVQAGSWLLSQRWPLNIRELSQCLEVAAALTEGPLIERAHLIERSLGPLTPPEEESLGNPEELRGRLVALLERHKGNVSHVARDMGKARVQVHRWMQKLSIDVGVYRS
jgi:pSer/pThr/pTyr-binding forkhead associated (FHA) protein